MNKLKKNTQFGKVNYILIFFYFILKNVLSPINASEKSSEIFIEMKILDKVSSKNNLLRLKIGLILLPFLDLLLKKGLLAPLLA